MNKTINRTNLLATVFVGLAALLIVTLYAATPATPGRGYLNARLCDGPYIQFCYGIR